MDFFMHGWSFEFNIVLFNDTRSQGEHSVSCMYVLHSVYANTNNNVYFNVITQLDIRPQVKLAGSSVANLPDWLQLCVGRK